MDNERYFSRTRPEYEEAIAYSAENAPEYTRALAAKLEELLHGHVADFGNGGIAFYDPAKLESLLCVDIANAIKPRVEGNARHVHGDFYEFEPPAGLDCALAQYLLHHLPDDERLLAALERLNRALGANGALIVVESVLPRPLEVVQRSLLRAGNALLALLRRPSLRFFSLDSLLGMLREAGFDLLVPHRIPLSGWISPAPVLFPRLRMPARLFPLKIVVVEARSQPGGVAGAPDER